MLVLHMEEATRAAQRFTPWHKPHKKRSAPQPNLAPRLTDTRLASMFPTPIGESVVEGKSNEAVIIYGAGQAGRPL